MFDPLANGLRQATSLTGAGRLIDATAAIQKLLRGRALPVPDAAQMGRKTANIDGHAEAVSAADAACKGAAAKQADRLRARAPFGEPFRAIGGHRPGAMTVPDGARFLAGTFTNGVGSRTYKLYVPTGYRVGTPVPLIVMLHGCTQTPDDFAAGTRMNEFAEPGNFLVAYPAQTRSANMQRCWNWFSAADQARDTGEPSLIAGITRQVMANYTVDPARVFVAGLSAGGAAAAVMANAYPDLYAAAGIHSGLACGAARDMPSALAAMRHGAAGPGSGTIIPTIVFHGDRDTTVSPRNGDEIVSQSASNGKARPIVDGGQVPEGHSYTRTTYRDTSGRTVVEHWVVHGATHAWSGGSPSGSYTDPKGPSASREMARFFLEVTAKQASAF